MMGDLSLADVPCNLFASLFNFIYSLKCSITIFASQNGVPQGRCILRCFNEAVTCWSFQSCAALSGSSCNAHRALLLFPVPGKQK